MFDKIYKHIIEEEEDIFKASSPEEGKRRKIEYVKLMMQDLVDGGQAMQNSDGSYDVHGISVDLTNLRLDVLPVSFNKVHPSFYCYGNKLTTLKGSPKEVQVMFHCANNRLSNLDCCPSTIGYSLDCSRNQLTSLKGCPTKLENDFYCQDNQLTSLEGCPKEVGGCFVCYNNKRHFAGYEVRKYCKVSGNIINLENRYV